MTAEELMAILETMTPQERKEVEHFVEFLLSKRPHRPRVSAMGKFAHIPTSSEEFCRRKQEEIDLEDRRWRKLRHYRKANFGSTPLINKNGMRGFE